LGYSQVVRRRALNPQRKGSIPFFPIKLIFFNPNLFYMSIVNLLENSTYLTLFICLILSFLLSGVILALSYNLALQTPDSEKTSAYECGFEPFEDARNRFDVRFYIVAILFLIFDLEVVYLFPWASTLAVTGYTSYNVIMFFLILLTIGFVYEVVKGALNIQ
jgi:NADH-quinone oxidoreductase subunit A